MKNSQDLVLDILIHANQLKRTARTGWSQRGIPEAENVAAHSYGVSFTTLILAKRISEKIDLEKALSMALLHDLPEGLTSDIPTPAWRFLPAGSKAKSERKAMVTILDSDRDASDLMAIWEEYQKNESSEARLVHDADKIDLYLQALIYQEQTNNQHLQEFWLNPAEFHFLAAQAIYDSLKARRGR
jgi:putative hydrolase of HD superfamily